MTDNNEDYATIRLVKLFGPDVGKLMSDSFAANFDNENGKLDINFINSMMKYEFKFTDNGIGAGFLVDATELGKQSINPTFINNIFKNLHDQYTARLESLNAR